MAVSVDPDLKKAGSHLNMIDHLTAPFAAGARDTPVPIDATGTATVDWTSREPLLLAAPLVPLEASTLRITATVPGAVPAATETIELEFAPYTEAEAFLPLWWLPPESANRSAAPFSVKITKLQEIVGGSKTTVAAAQIAGRIELRLVEGVFGRTVYLLGAEKQRLRRGGRELAAMRLLDRARDDALDRIGAELGMPRFADKLLFKNNTIASKTERESDDDYRRRLELFYPLFLRTYPRVVELLNGPGAAATPNAGPIGELALKLPQAQRAVYQNRFDVIEDDNPFAVGFRIVAAGDVAYRTNFFEFIRRAHLIWPRATQAANDVHAARFLPKGRSDFEDQVRKDVRSLFSFGNFAAGPETAVAPMLAVALARAARCVAALGGPSPWPMFRAQRADAGSRYELGLGVDVKSLTAAELTAVGAQHAALKAADPEFNQIADPDPGNPKVKAEIRGLLQSMEPQTAAADPDGLWLLEPCGLRTVHRIPQPANAPWPVTYLSHFPMFGMTVSESPPGQPIPVAGWTLLVPGRFGGQRLRSDLLAYEKEQGAGQIWTADSSGFFTGLTRLTGWPTTWSHIVAGRFSAAAGDELLFYDPVAGEVEVYPTDGEHLGTRLGLTQNVRKTWTHVIPYGFGPTTQLLFYDRAAGEAAFYLVDAQGQLKLQGQLQTGWRTTWAQIVPITSPSGYSDLFFYDPAAGEGVVYSPDGQGGMRPSGKPLKGLRKTWSHVAPGYFGGTTKREGLLFFDRAAGELELYDGDLELLAAHQGFHTTWHGLAVGEFAGGEYSEVLLYDRVDGSAEIWTGSGKGKLAKLRTQGNLPKSTPQPVEAKFHAPGDPGSNVVLVQGLASALSRWTGLGGVAWTVLTTAQAQQKWSQADLRQQADPALKTFRQAGLPAVEDQPAVVAKLAGFDPDLLDTIQLDAALAQKVVTNAATAADDLDGIAGLLKDERLTSVLPLVTNANEVLLVVGVVPLPVAGTNLYEEISSGFRWYVVPLEGPEGRIGPVGSRNQFTPAGPGLSAIVAIGYARRGLTDPYEYRVELPPGALLTLLQYEFLMNLLDAAYPAGVRVNTYSVRRAHVDVKSNGTAVPLDPTISRTYRAFRRPRHRGEAGVTLGDE